MKILKTIIVLGLVSGILYLGLQYCLSATDAPVSSGMKKDIEELKNLHEELAVFEQKIRDLQRDKQPYNEEETAAEELKVKIQALKTRIADAAPADKPALKPVGAQVVSDRLFSDRYQRVFVGVVGGLVILIILLVLIHRLRKRPAPQKCTEKSRDPAPPMVTDLKETLERFKAGRIPQMKKGETGEMDLAGLKPFPETGRPPRSAEQPGKETEQ